ncbi:MAG: prolyl-tRNA synthetase [Candidatus Taylorbacteria bacterium]|nr:prolyl-tRNA synthetase [Candidatus Taylorbacteria bacterium]
MKQSRLFEKTRREAPAEGEAENARLLTRAGFIHKELAGVYTFLPLGLKVLRKIEHIIRQEMGALGAEEMRLTVLQDRGVWEKTGRWSDQAVDNWFKTKVRGGGEAGLGFTHEEPLTRLMTGHIRSWRDLPVFVYQIQTKFRNEERARSGLLRGREFLMKDLYSFCRSREEHEEFYGKVKQSYLRIFDKAGLSGKVAVTLASGGSFSKHSHEFQVPAEAGEDTIHVCEKCGTGVNDEIKSETAVCPECGGGSFKKRKAIEVGNIFSLGTRFSEALGLSFDDESGRAKSAVMGSYGIGVSRLMGTVAELFYDQKGVIWPPALAPFDVHLLEVGGGAETRRRAEEIYKELLAHDLEVLHDDREARAGEKFADADLIGVPWRVIVGEKSGQEGELEVERRGEKSSMMPLSKFVRAAKSGQSHV